MTMICSTCSLNGLTGLCLWLSLVLPESSKVAASTGSGPAIGVDFEVFVSTTGSDSTGHGSIEQPFATLQKAVNSIEGKEGSVAVWLRCMVNDTCTFPVSSGVQLPSNVVMLATHGEDMATGNGAAVVSGGHWLARPAHWRPAPCSMASSPFSSSGTNFSCGLWQYDLSDEISDISNRTIHNIWVDGVRRRLVRSQMMQWLHSLDETNQTAEVNHQGFVYDSFPSYWSLKPESTSNWIMTAFHQWASDVHSIKEIIQANSTLLVNEPTYWKYAFDDNIHGNRRFFVENVPEEPIRKSSGAYRVVNRSVLVYAPPDGQSPANSDVVIPVSPWILIMNGSHDITIENLSLTHTAWLLPMQKASEVYPGSWRAAFSAEADCNHRLKGSGPLPVPTAAVDIRNASNIRLNNITMKHIGANGLQVLNVNSMNISRCGFYDMGSSGIDASGVTNFSISDSVFTGAGLTWRQGVGVKAGRGESISILHCQFANCSSDAIILTTSAYSTVAHNLFEALGNTHDNMSTAISDWGGLHTAIPNSTVPTVEVFNNVFRGFRSYSMGGNGLYFDYGTSGIHAHHNLIYNIGSAPLFLNSNGDVIEPNTTQPNYVHDNIFVHRNIRREDYNRILIMRTLVMTNFSSNIVYADCPQNDTAVRLVQDNSDIKSQFENQVWDHNVYYNTHPGTNARFKNTFPKGLTFAEWQATGHDQHSAFSDPLFIDPDQDHFQLRTNSLALKLGFTEFNHTDIGPKK